MSSLTIISVAIVVACIGPFVLISLNGRRKRRAIINRLRQACAPLQFVEEGCSVWGNSVIGIDVKGETLCFQKDETAPASLYPLQSLSGCRVAVQHSNEGGGLERVELCLLTGKAKTEQRILFFDSRERLDINNELMLAQEWQTRLNAISKAK